MDPQTPSPPNEKPTGTDHHLKATIDTSRPFSSVKEAVAIFGERLLAGELYSSPKPFTATASSTPTQDYSYSSPSKLSPSPMKSHNQEQEEALVDTVKRLEAELEETKMELNVLKEKESETEVALASLNAELHKNMSKIAQAEAAAAAKAAAVRTSSLGEEERRKGLAVKMEDSPTLARILGIGEEEDRLFRGRKERTMKITKKKPIVPLVTDLFSRKKDQSPASIHSSLFSSTHVFL